MSTGPNRPEAASASGAQPIRLTAIILPRSSRPCHSALNMPGAVNIRPPAMASAPVRPAGAISRPSSALSAGASTASATAATPAIIRPQTSASRISLTSSCSRRAANTVRPAPTPASATAAVRSNSDCACAQWATSAMSGERASSLSKIARVTSEIRISASGPTNAIGKGAKDRDARSWRIKVDIRLPARRAHVTSNQPASPAAS
ncbi:MAG: hypothetical protein V9G24_12170 [Rhodoblastus sp.]